MNQNSTFIEKVALLGIAAACVAALTWIALAALNAGMVDPNASTLIGVIAAGLIAFGKDIVAAVRSYAMSAQLGKVTDQLAASAPAKARPAVDDGDAGAAAAAGAQQATEAAGAVADDLAEQASHNEGTTP